MAKQKIDSTNKGLLHALDDSIVVTKDQKNGCDGCIFEVHEQCAKFAGYHLIKTCVDKHVIFIKAS